jgi:hypothetical protein
MLGCAIKRKEFPAVVKDDQMNEAPDEVTQESAA